MSKVCVVTGGGSGMGLSAAKFMPKDRIIVVSGRTESKLTKAVEQLREAGFEAYAKACDTSKRDSVKALAEYAASLGTITNVIHAAGVSPAMKGTMENILRINALGTVYVNQEFSQKMNQGSEMCIRDRVCRAAIEGGLSPEEAYALGDSYIQSAENAKTLEDLEPLGLIDVYKRQQYKKKAPALP